MHIIRSLTEIAICSLLLLIALFPVIIKSRSGDELYLVLTAPILLSFLFAVISGKKQISINVTDIFVFMWLIWCVANDFINQRGLYPTFIFSTSTALVFYIISRNIRQKKIPLYIIMATGFIQSAVSVFQNLNMAENNHFFFKVTGTFGNPALLGGCLAVCIVLTIGLLAFTPGNKGAKISVALLTAVMTVNLYALILSDSRSAWVAAITGSCMIAVYKKETLIRKVFSSAARKIIILLFFAFIAGAGYLYKKDSADGRLLIWKVTSGIIADKPVTGHGTMSFNENYMHYQARYFAGNPDSKYKMPADNVAYPYNELLRVWTERGLIGTLIVAALIISLLRYKSSDNTDAIYKAALVALVVFAMFSYPADSLFFIMLFALFTGILGNRVIWHFRFTRVLKYSIYALLAGSIYIAAGMYLFYRKADIHLNHLVSHSQNPKAAAEFFFHENYGRLKKNAGFMDVYSQYGCKDKTTAGKMKVYCDAMKVTPSSELSCDIGTLYEQEGNYEKALEYYTLSAHMIPSRVTPRYRMFKLYLAIGDTSAAKKTGEEILLQPTKAENTRTLKFKSEIRSFLEQNRNEKHN